MSEAYTIKTPRTFKPLLKASRYKGAYGGRGSGKSHFFAELAVERCLLRPKSRGVCVREVQKSLKESAKRLLEDKIDTLPASVGFRVKNDEILTPGGGVILFQGMQDHTAETIKSLEGFDWAWIEEAQTLSSRSLEMLRPTIRAPGSEIWATWNPRNATDPIDAFFRGQDVAPDSIVVRVNYDGNPWFPAELEMERLHDLRANPQRYAHIWLGEYEPQAIGAIWSRQMFSEWRRTLDSLPTLGRTLVAVDPAVSSEAGSNEHGIIVPALGEDQRGYILEDASLQGTPQMWGTRAVQTFDKWGADAVVIERNQGGDMCREVLRTIRPSLPIIEVTATRGKHVRAEPISALYAAGRISHVGTFPQLENQLCLITASGYDGEGSPDRADALVWGLSQLFPAITKQPERKKPSSNNNLYSGGWMS
jgi:hypothetical protein